MPSPWANWKAPRAKAQSSFRGKLCWLGGKTVKSKPQSRADAPRTRTSGESRLVDADAGTGVRGLVTWRFFTTDSSPQSHRGHREATLSTAGRPILGVLRSRRVCRRNSKKCNHENTKDESTKSRCKEPKKFLSCFRLSCFRDWLWRMRGGVRSPSIPRGDFVECRVPDFLSKSSYSIRGMRVAAERGAGFGGGLRHDPVAHRRREWNVPTHGGMRKA